MTKSDDSDEESSIFDGIRTEFDSGSIELDEDIPETLIFSAYEIKSGRLQEAFSLDFDHCEDFIPNIEDLLQFLNKYQNKCKIKISS